MEEKNELQELQNAALNYLSSADMVVIWDDQELLTKEDMQLLASGNAAELTDILCDRYHEKITNLENEIINKTIIHLINSKLIHGIPNRENIDPFIRSNILINLNIEQLINNSVSQMKKDVEFYWRVEQAIFELKNKGFLISPEEIQYYTVENTDGNLGNHPMRGWQWKIIFEVLCKYKLDYVIIKSFSDQSIQIDIINYDPEL